MRYFEKIPGARIYLSPMNPDDCEQYTQWLNDIEVARYLTQYPRMISIPSERKYLESASQDGQNYAIVLRDGDRLIGNISLMSIHEINRTATLGLFIGEADYRSKGYGAEAIRLILGFGFDWLNLNNIMLQVSALNEQAMACYRKVGFREIGRRTDAEFLGGRYADDVYMEMLARDFRRD